MRRLFSVAIIIASMAAAAHAQLEILGEPIPLDQLGEVLLIGDKELTNFFYGSSEDMPSADAVNVIPISLDGNFGLRVQAGFLDMAGGSPSDALLTFDVSPVSVDRLIDAVHLQANVATLGGLDGVASVTATFLPLVDDVSASVFDDGTTTQLSDTAVIEPSSTLPVQASVLLFAGVEDTAGATVSFFDLTFQQVPEPCGWLLLLGGGLGMFGRRSA